MKKIIIAIDGFSACGKSTLAKDLAKELGYAYIDTGAMYRAVTYYLIHEDIDPEDIDTIKRILPQLDITFKNVEGKNQTFLNGENIENEIRKMYVSEKVSIVAAISEVRKLLVAQQQKLGKSKGVVLDGRDIGTVVFPQAELKLFIMADFEVRAQRRMNELRQKNINYTSSGIQKNLQERDHIDSTREDSPLHQADDAILLDNTNLTREEQLEKAMQLAREAINE